VTDYDNLPSNITASGEFAYENPLLMSNTFLSSTTSPVTSSLATPYDNAPTIPEYDNAASLGTTPMPGSDIMTMVGLRQPPSQYIQVLILIW